MDNNIFIGSGEEHIMLFQNELPGMSYINFTGFKPYYSRFLPQYFALLLKIPLLLYHIIREHFILKKLIRKYSIDIVISDNRFGLWNKKVKTVYITHMPLIPLPGALRFLEIFGILLHRVIIKKYSLCFIPDLPGEPNLSGRLSHGIKLPENVRYIGILSRFISNSSSPEENNIKTDRTTVILSGPEPQRKILKQKLTAVLKDQPAPTAVMEGKPGKISGIVRAGNISYYNHLPATEMKEMIISSRTIIARSGYTSIMELISLNCSAILIPTPGQTEQEYLAGYLSEKGWFNTIPQDEIKEGVNLTSNTATWPHEMTRQSSNLLEEALKELLEKHHKDS